MYGMIINRWQIKKPTVAAEAVHGSKRKDNCGKEEAELIFDEKDCSRELHETRVCYEKAMDIGTGAV